jgi:hypothetical protein
VRVVFPLQFIVGFALLLPGTFTVLAETAPAPAVPTECDRLAAHPSDPDKLTEGVPTAQVRGWNDAAIWSCRQAVTRDAGDARQRYQLGRALFYAGERKEALEQLAIAAAAKYRQAQFVLGLMYTDGVPEVLEADSCAAMELWQDAADHGHFAARVALGRDWVRGSYRQCKESPTAAQVDEWLASARSESTDYYQRLLIDWARETLAAAR